MEYFFRIPQANHPARPQGSRNSKKERNGANYPISAYEIAQDTEYGEQVEGQGNRSVNTGFMKLEASGNLKRCRGKISPVKVKSRAYFQCTLDKGVTKHTNHDKEVHEGLEYVLLYPVHSEVINLPGTTSQSTSKAVKYIQTTLRVCCWLNFHWRGLASASLLIA